MTQSTEAALTVHLAPLLSAQSLTFVAVAGCLLFAVSALLYRRGLFWRSLCFGCFLMLFLNPSLVEEQREPVPDIAIIVADHSPSQQNGNRIKRMEETLSYLKTKIGGMKDIELRVVDVPPGTNATTRETNLFEAADQAFADVPMARRAGTILLTDGQVHDVPAPGTHLQDYGPVHTLLTGRKNERDRRLVITEAPAYGIVGQTVVIKYKVEDTKSTEAGNQASVIIRSNGKPDVQNVEVGKEQQTTITIDHAGQNIVDLEAEPLEDEITKVNNRAPVIINGVRDRLRVLLVSGQPHAGGRTWRDMLTSDPGVDLVHFTILREPDKLDATPQNELSLIAFPFHELFEVKLYKFDLIIFDRYSLNRILPDYYFANIAKYVRDGGALLEASGPSFTTDESIYKTEISSVLPAAPTGEIMEQPYRPALSEAGKRHPVTQDLHWQGEGEKPEEWGRWLRQIGIAPKSGEVLMTGVHGKPLLVLDRVDKGRVAQLASDQIWLWSRGYDGGGPNAELLRRLAHWLMKEPELEENALDVRTEGGALLIRRHTLDDKPLDVKVTLPDGTVQSATLQPLQPGMLEARMPAPQLGIYMVNDGAQQRFAIIGELNPPELRDVVTTPDILKPFVKETGGALLWLADTPKPDVRTIMGGRSFNGHNWLGLRSSNSFNVTGILERPILPMWGWACALLGLLLTAWWMEGRSKGKK